MSKKFVEIDDATLLNLEKIAKDSPAHEGA